MLNDLSDEALMAAVSARQQQAFRVLMARHLQRAIRVAQRIVRDAAEADDIGQDAFLRVWSQAASFDPGVARFTTWLYRIVVNLAFDRMRRRPLAPIEEASEVDTGDLEPVERMIENEERRMLELAMARLSERHRAAIALFHMEELSGEEAARVMNISAKAFESLLARARLMLKQQINNIENDRRCA